MLSKSIRILNFDDSVVKQKAVVSEYSAQVIDLRAVGPCVRFWLNKESKSKIAQNLRGGEKNAVTFLGSGDFHQVSAVLLEQFSQPLSLIVFDFHPDWDILPPRFGCGSWLATTLVKKNILKAVLLGVSSSDISTFSLQTGNLGAFKDDRLEIYPYQHSPALAFCKNIPANVSLRIERGIFFQRIFWQQIKEKNLEDFILSLIKRLPSREVYLSIDKDCLKKGYACTNWEEGMFNLDELLSILKLFKANTDIVGADIIGDYSPIKIKNPFKRWLAHLDHPKTNSASGLSPELITEINTKTNQKILEVLLGN
jgi:arginase family enzyme